MSLFCQSERSLRRWKLFVDVGTDCWVLNVPWMFHILHFDKCPIYLYPHFFKPSAHLASGSSDRTSWSDKSPSRSFQRTRQEWSLQRKKMCILSKRSSFAKILIILNLCSWCSWQLLWKFMGSPSSDIKSLFLVFPSKPSGNCRFLKSTICPPCQQSERSSGCMAQSLDFPSRCRPQSSRILVENSCETLKIPLAHHSKLVGW
jgi:hypothetical protein